MKLRVVQSIICIAVGSLSLFFLLYGSSLDFEYVIPNRAIRLSAMFLAGVSIAVASILFQTVSNNRILTPSVMGYEGIYVIFQTLLLLVLGTASSVMVDMQTNFLLSILVLLLYSFALQRWLFSGGKQNIYFLLLVGLVLTVILRSFSQLLEYSINPGEFSVLQSFSLTSFNRAQPDQLWIAFLLVTGVSGCIWRYRKVLDVLLLGREQAISLGINYHSVVRLQLGLIAILVAVSTSLVGPTAFMGVFVANIAYACARHANHQAVLLTGAGIAISVMVCAQILVEHLFNYKTSAGLLINLFCGLYFFILLVRPGRIAC